jgi:hypothetical protein
MKVILEQDKLNEIQNILNQFPISHLSQVEQIFKLFNESVEVQSTDPAPPIGGGGGSAKPPKSE